MSAVLNFLGPTGSLKRFPTQTELRILGAMTAPSVMDHFIQEVWNASSRLWILDLHFLPYGYHGVLEALSYARVRDVRIISGAIKASEGDKGDCTRKMQRAMDMAWSQGLPDTKQARSPALLQWRDTLSRNRTYPFPHDRFVILDDAVWHFGFSSCGSGNHLSAVSGPWSARLLDAIEFFEDLWYWSGDV